MERRCVSRRSKRTHNRSSSLFTVSILSFVFSRPPALAPSRCPHPPLSPLVLFDRLLSHQRAGEILGAADAGSNKAEKKRRRAEFARTQQQPTSLERALRVT